MKKIIQTKLHDPPNQRGNCFATCIACFLDLEINEVPAFETLMNFDDPSDHTWAKEATRFLSEKGFMWGSLEGHISNDEFYLVTGKSSRGVNHCCIYQNGKLFHDPHPSQEGLLTEEFFEYIEKV